VGVAEKTAGAGEPRAEDFAARGSRGTYGGAPQKPGRSATLHPMRREPA